MISGLAFAAAGLAAAILVVPTGRTVGAPPPLCNGRPATIVGTPGNDRLEGTAGDDVIAGLGGNDRLTGLDGDDVLCGGPGDDQLTSYDQGRDVLVAGPGDDFVGSFENPHARVRMGRGDDYASSQVGDDVGWSLDGGPGRDHLFLNLTLALHDAGPMPGQLELREGWLVLYPHRRIVSGSVDDWDRRRFYYIEAIAASRTWEAHRVYRMMPDAWVIASESTGDEAANREQFAPAVHDALVQLGIPSSHVVILREPADTHDEAVRIAPLVKSLKVDHVVLVTSDIHMRRSLGALRAQGVDVIPAIARDPFASQLVVLGAPVTGRTRAFITNHSRDPRASVVRRARLAEMRANQSRTW